MTWLHRNARIEIAGTAMADTMLLRDRVACSACEVATQVWLVIGGIGRPSGGMLSLGAA